MPIPLLDLLNYREQLDHKPILDRAVQKAESMPF